MDDKRWSRWVTPWEQFGEMWGRCQLEGDQVVYVIQKEAEGGGVQTAALASRNTLREWDETTDPMGMIVRPDSSHTVEDLKRLEDEWLVAEGNVLLDEHPELLAGRTKVAGPWKADHHDSGDGATRVWFDDVPAAKVMGGNLGFWVWVSTAGGPARRGGEQVPTFREACDLADRLLVEEGWTLPEGDRSVVLLSGVPVVPDLLDRRLTGPQAVEVGSFPWAALMVREGYLLERESVGRESRWHWDMSRAVTNDDLRAEDWAVVGEAPDEAPPLRLVE